MYNSVFHIRVRDLDAKILASHCELMDLDYWVSDEWVRPDDCDRDKV